MKYRIKGFCADMGTYAFWGLLFLPGMQEQRRKRVVKCFPVAANRSSDSPVGGVWKIRRGRKGADGKSIVVQTPEGPWFLDEQACNCTRQDDDTHRCWPRHGNAKDGTLSVQKKFGPTCGAGAGSIRIGTYHARLLRGHLIRVPF
jgi:hypothetical protein